MNQINIKEYFKTEKEKLRLAVIEDIPYNADLLDSRSLLLWKPRMVICRRNLKIVIRKRKWFSKF